MDLTWNLAINAVLGGDKPMTRDTERAMEAILPLAKALDIKVTADGNTLYCNDQAIGIACNSTSATIKEFIGYCFQHEWIEGKWSSRLTKADTKPISNGIKAFWHKEKS